MRMIHVLSFATRGLVCILLQIIIVCVPHLDECADDAEAGESEVLKGPALAHHRVQERVQVHRDVRCHASRKDTPPAVTHHPGGSCGL
jgi:hypothetical protein